MFTYCTTEQWEDEHFDLDYITDVNGSFNSKEDALKEAEKHGATLVITVEETQNDYRVIAETTFSYEAYKNIKNQFPSTPLSKFYIMEELDYILMEESPFTGYTDVIEFGTEYIFDKYLKSDACYSIQDVLEDEVISNVKGFISKIEGEISKTKNLKKVHKPTHAKRVGIEWEEKENSFRLYDYDRPRITIGYEKDSETAIKRCKTYGFELIPMQTRPITEVNTQAEIIDIIETREPKGLFFIKDEDDIGHTIITAVDNTTGDAWTEDFSKLEDVIDWLYGYEKQDVILADIKTSTPDTPELKEVREALSVHKRR